MKKLRLLLLISLIISCIFAFASCDDTEVLSTPQGVEIEQATLTLRWKSVKDARLYTVSTVKDGEEPKEAVVSKTYYSLTGLTEGNYTIKVKANGKDGVSRDSEWSASISFEREKESGMIFTLINGNTEYEVTGKGAATGDIVIPDTYRTLPVTSIGDKAFFNKSDVASVVIGKNVKRIGDNAFGNCSYLTSVTIPEGLTSIGKGAFSSCRLLSSKIVIPDGVTLISQNAFAHCGNIPEIELSDNITVIEATAFIGCAKLVSIELPENLEIIGDNAFKECKALTSVTFGSKVKEIGQYSFRDVTSLVSISLPNSVETIGVGAFKGAVLLNNVELGNGIKEIDYKAFDDTALWNDSVTNEIYAGNWFLGCKDNTAADVVFKDGTVGIASHALENNTGLLNLILPDSVQIIGKRAFANMKITAAVIGSGARELGDEAFASCKDLYTLILGSYDDRNSTLAHSTLQTIGAYAFRGCEGLETIVMPSSLKEVGTWAFRETALYNKAEGVVYADKWVVDHKDESLASNVKIANGTVGIAKYAFYQSSALKSIEVPDSVKIVCGKAFYECGALESVVLPDTLERIEDYTFYKCRNLKLFPLPTMLTYIGRYAFYKCGTSSTAAAGDTDNDVLYIPVDVTYIGQNAFYYCGYAERASLEDEQYYNYRGIDVIIFNNSLEYIGSGAFYCFSSLKRIELGGTKHIGEKAFYQCEQLTTVDFGTRLETIGDKAFYKCTSLEAVKIPDTLDEIGKYAFYRCESIKEVDLGVVSSIGSFAFYGNTSMTKLNIPSTVTFIGKQAFRNCKGLTSVILASNVETIEQHAFYGCSALTIYVDANRAPAQWHKYWNSSYRPVVYNCVLSDDGTYVLYVEKGTVANLNSINFLSDPIREGYTFVGWGNSATADVPAFTSANLSEAESGRKLYAIWAEEQN